MSKSEDELRAEGERLLSENLPTENQVGTIAMHTIFDDLRNAGFSRFEALWLIGYMMTQAGKVENDG